MQRPPRNPKDPILSLERWIAITLYGLLITAVTLGTYTLCMYVLDLSNGAAITVSFLTLACAQLWHVFNMREADSGLLRNEVTRNPFIWGALLLCLGLLAGAVYIPALSGVLGLIPPDGTGWALIAIGSLIPLLVGQVVKQYLKGRIRPARSGSVEAERIAAHQ